MMNNVFAVWLEGSLLVTRWSSPKVILTDFYLPDTGYQPGEYIGVIDAPDEVRWSYESMLDRQSNRDKPVILSYPEADKDFDWQLQTGEPAQAERRRAKMLFFPVRPITLEERDRMILPALPKSLWVTECFRLGINPLDIVRKHFPGWKWDCRYRLESSNTGSSTWTGYTGIGGKYFSFRCDFPPLYAELVAERIS